MVRKLVLVPFALAAITGVPAFGMAQHSRAGDELPGTRESLAEGAECCLETKLTANTVKEDQHFGVAVALKGHTMLIGASEDDNVYTYAGAAFVFERTGSTWTQQKKLTANNKKNGAFFGSAVSLSGDRALITANKTLPENVYVFVRSGATWTQEDILRASDGGNDGFGDSVSLFGDTALIGSPLEGAVFVFERNGPSWTEVARLTASNGSVDNGFGASVMLSGDTALIGAPDEDDNGQESGSAYVFVQSGGIWVEVAKLLPSDGATGDLFGSSVSLSANTVLIGAPEDDHSGMILAGSAYVFEWSGTSWTETAKLTANDSALDDQALFGTSVSLDGDRALVGAHQSDANGLTDSGAAYLFVRNAGSWIEELKLTASDGAAVDNFGTSVFQDGNTSLVGAHQADVNGLVDAGSAYVFSPPGPWTYCTAGVSASGCQASIGYAGVPSASATSGFSLVATSVEGSKDGLFFFGTAGPQGRNSWGNGTSYQCVMPPVVRTPTTAGVGTIGLCDGSFALDLNAHWCPSCPYPQKNPGFGAVVQAQLWYRDPASTSNQTTSLSDAIEFVVAP
jgi:hypothetical protein